MSAFAEWGMYWEFNYGMLMPQSSFESHFDVEPVDMVGIGTGVVMDNMSGIFLSYNQLEVEREVSYYDSIFERTRTKVKHYALQLYGLEWNYFIVSKRGEKFAYKFGLGG